MTYSRVKFNQRPISSNSQWRLRYMIKLYDTGVYLVNGSDLCSEEAEVLQKTGCTVTKSDAVKVLQVIQRDFPKAFIIKDIINYPL